MTFNEEDAREKFEKYFKEGGYQYNESAKQNAMWWFIHGYEAACKRYTDAEAKAQHIYQRERDRD